jgi:purine nucleosidase
MRSANLHILGMVVVCFSLAACGGESDSPDASASLMAGAAPQKVRVLLDTDANNELDDQHAIAYLLFNGDRFQVEGITVNRTPNGGGIDEQVEEAVRIVKLSGLYGETPVLAGADGSYEEIVPLLGEPVFDGSEWWTRSSGGMEVSSTPSATTR